MRKVKFENECALARVLVQWLRADGWAVYQEVHDGSATCDVVATRGPLVWGIETKLQFGCAVLEQATGWLSRAHLVSVATPPSRPSVVLRSYAKAEGIGWLVVTAHGLHAELEPRLHRVREHRHSLRRWLRPEQMTGVEAGGNGGGYFTPFKDTCRKVAAFVARNPGINLRELVTGLESTHYASKASARSGIAHWAQEGKIPGVELRREGKRLRLFPKEAQP